MESRPQVSRWILVGGLAVFLVYALNFFNFFVDDEGIPLVYAQNLIRGRGLTYTAIEGPIEGYSDFLHVLIDALLLVVVKALHWRKVSAFFAGDTLALAAGIGVVAVVFATVRRSAAVRTPGAVAGIAVLALSGPLAVWSCSSLETVPFTFFLTLILFGLVAGAQREEPTWVDRLVVVAGIAAILDRLDGPVYVTGLVGAFMVSSGPARRQAIYRRIIWPLGVAVVVYHGWRVWYFRDLLNMPLHAKVMYKLTGSRNLVTKPPSQPYAVAFIGMYGWPAMALAGAAAAYGAWRERTARPILIALSFSVLYVSIVGDWMFGFRFFVHLMPLAALMLALAISIVFRPRPGAAWAATIAVVISCTMAAAAFERQYEAEEERPSWWRSRSFDERQLFGNYYGTYEAVRDRIGSGMTVAYSQAGFVPFMLSLESLDPLGICSRFYAELPTRDVFFTEVGRYSPFTAAQSINAEHAYLLYQNVPFIIERRDLIRKANGGRIPDVLMGGYYELMPTEADGDVIYRRTGRDASEYKHNPRLFFENVAHVAYLRSASINGQTVPRASFLTSLPFLRQGTGHVETVRGRYTLDLQFADSDVEVSELDITRIEVGKPPIRVTLDVRSADGTTRAVAEFAVAEGPPRDFIRRLSTPVMASRLSLRIDAAPGAETSVWLTDVRVQGQTPELARYIRERLSFAPSQKLNKTKPVHR